MFVRVALTKCIQVAVAVSAIEHPFNETAKPKYQNPDWVQRHVKCYRDMFACAYMVSHACLQNMCALKGAIRWFTQGVK